MTMKNKTVETWYCQYWLDHIAECNAEMHRFHDACMTADFIEHLQFAYRVYLAHRDLLAKFPADAERPTDDYPNY
jgi:hypothetical protein